MTTDTLLRLERDFDTPRERVFDAWLDPNIFPRWFGPQSVRIADFGIDARQGGDWHAVMENGEGQRYHVSGIYHEIARPDRLVFTWAWHNDGIRGEESVVHLTFEDTGNGTRLIVEHHGLVGEDAVNHNEGWDSSLASLAEELGQVR
ncbi:SRPBCC family protein [Hyphobacterium marinum]|uniref:SRPBCC domain-containing protein n=1 Tax=Hyphobacterium marinum TaxID=3116574 RepID=A0ABU7LWV3_9PROT|nr:SRPBCC domain-containing protein [Hyphobacterium sp. Y6023]MEE2566021.1 SRPBCC domain-containing protein [Hyphobacterium sp. Y6023]